MPTSVVRGMRRAVAAFGLAALFALACRPAPQPQTATQPATASSPPRAATRFQVAVSILPQADFVERVGGESIGVAVLVGPGQNPHSFEPTPDQMSALSKARVYFRIGLPFEEPLLPKLQATFRQLEVVDTRQGIQLRRIAAHESGAHADDEHDHAGGDDPHIWLDPKLVKIQAQTIGDALCRLDPPHADEYRRNLTAFHADLDALDARLAVALAPVKGKDFFVFHPAFGYFADAYGLRQVPVEAEGKEPPAKVVAALIQRARAAGVKVIFVQPQFSTRTAAVIAEEIGGAVVPLDDLPREYIKSMEAMAEQVRKGLSGG